MINLMCISPQFLFKKKQNTLDGKCAAEKERWEVGRARAERKEARLASVLQRFLAQDLSYMHNHVCGRRFRKTPTFRLITSGYKRTAFDMASALLNPRVLMPFILPGTALKISQ